ncbi:Nuclear pore complex protein an-nup82 [Lasiodiplodia theobromae]|uniref:Nuclear pore complex protein an-nup82 n=1 Tax=Lasiodiplodia theobromae TaxID=45133 RepID=UPI0015C36BFB|nr:Nuclear pore complex protein an-nup82 [Lasiodiplodia theobromae]KAF4542684.1 Nuclear pore complex protein an-nup82 [Lasiodiplodia theobromae]
MPRVLSYTPAWLSRGAPGFDIFDQSSSRSKSPRKFTNGTNKLQKPGPKRTIAHRGNEIFVVVGNEIRWANLLHLRERGLPKDRRDFGRSWRSARGDREPSADVEEGQAYRILKTNVSGEITELSISPNEDYMAICTSHTIHIALLPDPAHLSTDDTGPIKLKTFQLGPTAHVLDQAPLASALWHPLGRHGRCLVTVTADANVRLWEFNRENRVSFSEPELAIDLKKLASGVDSMEDFRASRIGDKTGFTPDSFEMAVAAATFGTSGKKGERGWGPLTLWVAMKNGDIYALCPLLPKKWQYTTQHAAPQYLRSLALPIQARIETLGTSEDEEFEQQTLDQQAEWFEGIRYELEDDPKTGEVVEVYSRPIAPGPIPRLQGPFIPDPDLDIDHELTDIIVITPGDGYLDEPEQIDTDGDREDPNVTVIGVVTSQGKMHIFIDFDGATTIIPNYDCPPLIFFETVEFQTSEDGEPSCSPIFTGDAKGGSSLFISTETGVYYVSMTAWFRPLQDELSNPESEGSGMRIDAIMRGSGSLLESIIQYRQDQHGDLLQSTSAAIAISNSELGYFLLTSEGSQPHSAVLDSPESDYYGDGYGLIPYGDYEAERFNIPEPWPAYQPPQSLFDYQSQLPKMLEAVPERHKFMLKQEIRLSTATLDVLTKAHRVLVKETQQLGQAASSLYTRCQRLQDELRDQIRKANDVAQQIEGVTGDDEEFPQEGEDKQIGSAKVDSRIEKVKARQKELLERTERLRNKLNKAGTRELSDKERAWFAEVDKMKQAIINGSGAERNGADEDEVEPTPVRRLQQVKQLKDDLIQQASELQDTVAEEQARTGVQVPSEFRKVKVKQIMELLERETAMVEAATKKLRKLTVGATGY